MTDNEVTLRLDGQIPLASFVEAMQSLNGLMKTLGDDVAPSTVIEWTVIGLESGSAIATIQGTTANVPEWDEVRRVTHALAVVARSLHNNTVVPYSPRVREQARRLVGVIKGPVKAIHLKAADEEEEIIISAEALDEPRLIASYGSVEGRVLTLSSRHGLQFNLYDAVYDRAVACFIDAQRVEEIRQVWRKRVRVDGLVSRDIASGRPESIHNIDAIRVIEPKTAGGFESTRGVAPRPESSPDAVEAIRRVRDAW